MRQLTWHFPLSRPLTGIPLGNGVLGVLVWGTDVLNLTIARAGFWDHRGGHTIPEGTTYQKLRRCLEENDSAGVAELFPPARHSPGEAPFPQQIGGGRLSLSFEKNLRPICATLHLETATLEILLGTSEDDLAPQKISIRQTHEDEICWLDFPKDLTFTANLVSAYELMRENDLGSIGIAPPEYTADRKAFVQHLPDDEPLAVAFAHSNERLIFSTGLGRNALADIQANISQFDPQAAGLAADQWRLDYWKSVPSLELPDAVLQELYDFGLYKQAGLIRNHAPAATLQGPWMEDLRIPPWSNDYHFNINVQLVYGAALATNQAAGMQPLWDMLRSWLPQLREAGERFYEMPGAMLLPHAVDDRGQLMGEMWAGTIDQACIAWMAHLAWQTYRHTLDETFLRDLVWPLLEGAFLGYYAMLESVTDNGLTRLSLPVSVSPEFGGSEMQQCWGRDASFQLAALHATVAHLCEAAPLLGLTVDPRWQEVAENLPPYTTVPSIDGSYTWLQNERSRIALWENQDLPESHRHHSHLAAIHPFQTIDPFDPDHQRTVTYSLHRWSTMGPGNWTGWCLPWASMICSRCGLPDAAISWLHLFEEAFTNEGRATLHNANHAGMFGWDDGSLAWPDYRKGNNYQYYEISEVDSAMGAVEAILEMLVQVRDDVICITDRLPKRWRDLSFSRIHTEGAFLVSAIFRHKQVQEVTVQSLSGAPLRLRHSIPGQWKLDGVPKENSVLEMPSEAGRTYHLVRA